MISLTREDWSEIFYALESKALAVRRGRYGSEDASGEDFKWIAHLDELRQMIGPDGAKAAREGVGPVGPNPPRDRSQRPLT
jgi:hypothetical protein